MAHKFYKENKLSVADQIFDLRKKYKVLNLKTNANSFKCNIEVQPSPLSKKYVLTLNYDGIIPKVYLYNQGILRNAEDKVKHCYEQKYINESNECVRLCLYYPNGKEWDNTMLISETIIPWALAWLYYYENWRVTGKWLGGGIEHEKN